MDKEIKVLKEKIIELNIVIENLRNKLKENETIKPKTEKNINEKFCELYQNFAKKKTYPIEIDMIIGMHLSKQEKKYEKKYNNLLEVQSRLKKRIENLTSQLNIIKYGKKMPSDLEEHKFQFDVNDNIGDSDNRTSTITEIKKDYKCNTFQKYINSEKKMNNLSKNMEIGNQKKKLVDTQITTTTQISYKRRRRGGNNQ